MKEHTSPLALVEEIQQRLNLIRAYLGDTDVTKPAVLPKGNQENEIRRCILQLMETNLPDHRNRQRPVFFKASHWQAVYRILVDYGLGAVDGDYIGFGNWMKRIIPDDCRIPFSYDALRSISKTSFVRPFAKWHYDPTYSLTRLPYENMYRVAETFLQLLKQNGIINPLV
jgi:hypothetical protein